MTGGFTPEQERRLGEIVNARLKDSRHEADDHLDFGLAHRKLTPLSLVTALPTSPRDGQVCYYQASATLGVVWAFRYNLNSASSYKWECVGGIPLEAEVATDETTVSIPFVALATAGPSITAPLAGDYLVEHGFTGRPTVGPAICMMSYDIGGTGAVDEDGVDQDTGGANISVGRCKRQAGLAASTALVAKYRVSASTGNFRRRWMKVMPIRVG